MIKKLRRKFINISMLSVFVLLVLILGTINIVNFSIVASDADRVTEMIMNNGGTFAKTPPEGPQLEGGPMGPSSPETPSSTRYFTYSFNKNGEGQKVSYNISIVNEEEALSWASDLLNSRSSKGWSRTSYRYRIYNVTSNNRTYVTVIDQSRELTPSYYVLWASIIGSLVGLIITFIVLLLISKRVIKPIEDSQRMQKRFISDASHELKTPLTIISANNEILEMDYGETLESKEINKQINHLTNIINDLNSLAKFDEAKPNNNDQEFDLSKLVKDISNSFIEPFKEKGKRFEFNISENIFFKGNENQIGTLISSILENALKYSLSSTSLILNKDGERIIIEEINDSNDIEEGPLDQIFERFYRSDEAREKSKDGSGLGLSIAKEIVNLHHGRIYAKGEKGKFILKVEF